MGYVAAAEIRFYKGDDFALEWHLQYNHYPPISLEFLPVAKKAVKLARNGELGTRLLMPNQVVKTVAEVVEELHLFAFLDEQDA